MSKTIKLSDYWYSVKIPAEESIKLFDETTDPWDRIGSIKDMAVFIRDNMERKFVFYKHFDDKIMLSDNNMIALPPTLLNQVGWKSGDELYADIFDEELEQLVIGKKLSGEDAIKGLDKISSILK